MKATFLDILERAGWPDWWDMDGVPRYGQFEPSAVSNIYANVAALLLVECQACGAGFRVAVHHHVLEVKDSSDTTRMILERNLDDPIPFRFPESGDAGSFYYGDPPHHEVPQGISLRTCGSGASMSTIPRRVLEFHQRLDSMRRWARSPEYEGQDLTPDWAGEESLYDELKNA